MVKEKLVIMKTIKKIKYAFTLSGTLIYSQGQTPLKNLLTKLLYFINTVSLNSYTPCMGILFTQASKKGIGFTSLTYWSPGLLTSFLGNAKSIFFIIYEKQVNELFSTLNDLAKKENDRDEVDERENIIKKEIHFLEKLINISIFINISMMLMFPLMPALTMVIKYFNTKEFKMIVPFITVCVSEPDNIITWPFFIIHQSWSWFVTSFEIFGADCLFYILCTYIRIQFRLLKHDIEKNIGSNFMKGNVHNDVVEADNKLNDIVRWHQELIKSVELLDFIYSKSTLSNFLISSAIICIAGFDVMVLDDKQQFQFLSMLIMSLVQIFFFCYFADKLMESSAEVGDGVYNCKWYFTEKRVVKILKMIQLRAAKPSMVTAFKFADVNMISFSKILKTSWSYFALLNTLYSQRRE